jgi:hypothetical protein
MEYRKPEIVLVENAVAAIQSNLAKGGMPGDSQDLGPQTGPAAYEADE